MSDPDVSDKQLRQLLYHALGKWRSSELAFAERKILDIKEKIVALDNRTLEPDPNKAETKSQLEENAARWKERMDDRIAMIEETYEKMIDFVDRRERDDG